MCGNMQGLQSLWLHRCCVGGNDSSRSDLITVVRAIACLPDLRDLRLACLSQGDAAASTAAAMQLARFLVASKTTCNQFVSLMGQVHKLVGLHRLWIDSELWMQLPAGSASSLVHLTELCLLGMKLTPAGATLPMCCFEAC